MRRSQVDEKKFEFLFQYGARKVALDLSFRRNPVRRELTDRMAPARIIGLFYSTDIGGETNPPVNTGGTPSPERS